MYSIATLTPDSITYLLAVLARSQPVTQQAINRLVPEDFDRLRLKAHAVIWASVLSYYSSCGQLPSKAVLKIDVGSRLSVNPISFAEDVERQAEELIETIYHLTDQDLQPEYGRKVLQKFLDEVKVKPAFSGDGQSLPELISTINTTYATTRITSAESFNPFDLNTNEADETTSPRVPTGSLVYDTLVHGGMEPGELAGVLGPSGGGKSMLGIDVVVNKALNGGRSLLFTYEQPVKYKIRNRVWNCATALHRKEIDGIPLSKMHPTARSKIEKAQAMIGDRCRLIDMTTSTAGYGGVHEMDATLKAEIASGRKPDVVVLDWLVLMVQREMEAKNVGDMSSQLRHYLAAAMRQLKELAMRHEIGLLVLNQLGTTAGSKRAGSELTQYDGAEDQGMPRVCDTFVTIGATDAVSKVCLAQLVKSRFGPNQGLYLHVDGDHHQLSLTGTEYAPTRSRDGRSRLTAKRLMDSPRSAELSEDDVEDSGFASAAEAR